MTLSLDKIAALTPDQGSVDAARKLLKPTNWPKLEADATGLAWGECQGSGATPYRVVIAGRSRIDLCTHESIAGLRFRAIQHLTPCASFQSGLLANRKSDRPGSETLTHSR